MSERPRGQTARDEYSERFYERMRDESGNSARQIVPLVLDLVKPRSVIDVGCGIGTWLAIFRERGVTTVHGVDGSWVEIQQLLIPPADFQTVDLVGPLNIDGQFDLAISMEVAEHLPPAAGDSLVVQLTKLAPAVLFSAAIPYQGGVHHVNEQWQTYWAERFNARGYMTVDCVRAVIWDNARVAPYYAQNTLLFVEANYLGKSPELQAALAGTPRLTCLNVVHPKLFVGIGDRCRERETEIERLQERCKSLMDMTGEGHSLKTVLRRLPALIGRAARRHLGAV